MLEDLRLPASDFSARLCGFCYSADDPCRSPRPRGGKTFEAAHTTSRTQVNARNPTMPTTTEQRIADRYMLRIRLEDGHEVSYAVPQLTGESMEVGQQVQVTYVRRSLKPFFDKLMVREISSD